MTNSMERQPYLGQRDDSEETERETVENVPLRFFRYNAERHKDEKDIQPRAQEEPAQG